MIVVIRSTKCICIWYCRTFNGYSTLIIHAPEKFFKVTWNRRFFVLLEEYKYFLDTQYIICRRDSKPLRQNSFIVAQITGFQIRCWITHSNSPDRGKKRASRVLGERSIYSYIFYFVLFPEIYLLNWTRSMKNVLKDEVKNLGK